MIVNFAVKQQGLEAQLLNTVVKQERADLDRQKNELVLKVAQGKRTQVSKMHSPKAVLGFFLIRILHVALALHPCFLTLHLTSQEQESAEICLAVAVLKRMPSIAMSLCAG